MEIDPMPPDQRGVDRVEDRHHLGGGLGHAQVPDRVAPVARGRARLAGELRQEVSIGLEVALLSQVDEAGDAGFAERAQSGQGLVRILITRILAGQQVGGMREPVVMDFRMFGR
jgi:hypothetical protein